MPPPNPPGPFPDVASIAPPHDPPESEDIAKAIRCLARATINSEQHPTPQRDDCVAAHLRYTIGLVNYQANHGGVQNLNQLVQTIQDHHHQSEARFTQLTAQMNQSFTQLNTEMNQSFTRLNNQMNHRFTRLNTQMNQGFDDLSNRFQRLEVAQLKHENFSRGTVDVPYHVIPFFNNVTREWCHPVEDAGLPKLATWDIVLGLSAESLSAYCQFYAVGDHIPLGDRTRQILRAIGAPPPL